ncbi:DUF1360 domain-containing protein [Vibrio sp. YIC-376]|uniref:DUF1360 domain-containing protein n=1 Tax=Vibrio sp. YIC-376 TaxID=3136162 RepID=UPI00402ADE00
MIELLNTPQAEALWICFVLAVAASSISITITQTELFIPVQNIANKCGHMIGYLFKCFYCMKHWVVILGMAVYHPRIIMSDFIVIDWLVSTFFTITVSSLISGFLFDVFIKAMNKKLKQKDVQEALQK